MMYENSILEKVKEFIKQGNMFTSIDIANEVKKEGLWVRNIEVRDWLHKNYQNKSLFMGYSTSSILVVGNTQATLYHPALIDPENYVEREQLPLTPDQVKSIQKVKIGKYKSNLDIKDILNTKKDKIIRNKKTIDNKGKKTRVSSLNSNSVVLCSKKRLRIPGEYIRKMGWKPGDNIDPSLILTTKNISSSIKVGKDYRVSIPRNSVPWGTDPIKVTYREKDGKIHFSKV